ncbi:TetR family transcriptional regulator [Streptomyces sp. NPDC090119]|uniref:TetR/AcrR family transcriptional regulator n=1 Tax=Streptomyces sp. NPDC090119 TaxID=3365951 RepID=UPI0038217BFD
MATDSADDAPRPSDRPRRRDAAATRTAILDSAVRAFSRHGYDGVGVREIAADAGCSAMLVNRYFGSKEGLFEEAVHAAFAPRTVIPESDAPLARSLARRLVERTDPDAETLSPFLLLLRSAANPRAAAIMARAIERHPQRALRDQLDGEHLDQRAMLADALIAGVWLMRAVLDVAGSDDDADSLAPYIERMLAPVLGEDATAAPRD